MNGVLSGVMLYMPPGVIEPIRQAVMHIKYQSTARTAGLKTTSRVFGFQPRVTIRRDFCTVAALAREAPPEHNALCLGARLASTTLCHYAPDQYAQQEKILTQSVKQDWILPHSIFTSGIVNWNNQLRYHFDAGNFEGSWNAMLTFKKDMEGGYLAIPEVDAALAVRDGTLSIFNAQGLLHGVTPFKKLSPRAYRYTIVYYALQGMSHCGTLPEELARIRAVKTEREKKRSSK